MPHAFQRDNLNVCMCDLIPCEKGNMLNKIAWLA